MDQEIKMRKCSICGVEHPETEEFFQLRINESAKGLRKDCRVCVKLRQKLYKRNYVKANPELIKEQSERRRKKAGYKEKV